MGKIVIRAPNHLGDSLMAQPAIRAFAESTQDGEIHILCPSWAEPIYRNIVNVKLPGLKKRYLHGPHAIAYQTRLVRTEKFEIGVLLTPSFSSALVLYLSSVRSRYGYAGNGRGFLLNHRFEPRNSSLPHRSQQYLHLLEYAAGRNLAIQKPILSLPESARKAASKLLKDRGVTPSDRFVAIAPQAVAESRRWGSHNYRALARLFIRDLGIGIVLIGAVDEYKAGKEIAGDEQNILNLCGKTNIESAGAILSAASLFIGNDSGLAHLAAAVDTPLVVLSGADRPSETSPISTRKVVIIKDYLDCISCVKNKCLKRRQAFMKCMRDISVEEVYDAALNFLQ